MSNAHRKPLGWFVSSLTLLMAGDEALLRRPPEEFARAWIGLLLQSLLWGEVLVNVWGLAWMIFGGYAAPLVLPAAMTLAAFVLGPYRRSMAAMQDVFAPKDAALRSTLAGLWVTILGMALMALPLGPYIIEAPTLPWWLDWTRPGASLYRVLFLMPVWGGWSMIITPQFCRPREITDAATAAFARGCPAIAAAACLVLPLAGSVFYFHYLGIGGQTIIGGAGALGAILAGLLCCRLAGGLTRKGLLAANFLTQLVFVIACQACR